MLVILCCLLESLHSPRRRRQGQDGGELESEEIVYRLLIVDGCACVCVVVMILSIALSLSLPLFSSVYGFTVAVSVEIRGGRLVPCTTHRLQVRIHGRIDGWVSLTKKTVNKSVFVLSSLLAALPSLPARRACMLTDDGPVDLGAVLELDGDRLVVELHPVYVSKFK